MITIGFDELVMISLKHSSCYAQVAKEYCRSYMLAALMLFYFASPTY
jgi:hypothetical protein